MRRPLDYETPRSRRELVSAADIVGWTIADFVMFFIIAFLAMAITWMTSHARETWMV